MVAMPIGVPAGRISQISLHIVSAQIVFNDGTFPVSLDIPSSDRSGLKLNVDRELPSGGTISLGLDFDVAGSIHQTGNGTYTLRPTIRVQ